jgi:hypothetical protein
MVSIVLNPGPLGHESSALTTRPRLLAIKFLFLIKTSMQYANEELKIKQLKNSLSYIVFTWRQYFVERIFQRILRKEFVRDG